MSELIYDIQNKTYLTGRSLDTGNNRPHVANMQANDDEENEAQILRSITSAFSILRNRLAEYLDNAETTTTNDSVQATEDLILALKMPSNFNGNVTKTLGEAAHQFIVSTSIAEWFAITAKGETADYTASAARSLEILDEALCKRIRPERV